MGSKSSSPSSGLLRRSQTAEPHESILEFGRFRLDPSRRQLLREGQAVPLTGKAFDTLLALARNRDRLVTREELMQLVWPDSFVADGNLTQNVSLVRKALSEQGGSASLLVTVAGRGYRFVADVRAVPDGVHETVNEAAVEGQHKAVASLELPSVRSLAVLPFTTLGSPDDPGHLGLGITDALITRLGNVRLVATRPTSSVLRYAGVPFDVGEAGKVLEVDAVLEGRLQRSGDRLRVNVQLVLVKDRATALWAETFDTGPGDLFALQDSIVARVVEALRPQLAESERRRLAHPETRSHAAFDLYLEGRCLVVLHTHDAITRALAKYERAVALDPEFSLAHAAIAETYFFVATFFMSPLEALPKMKASAERAVALDPDLAEAHTLLAAARMNLDWDWEGADAGFRRALDLNPHLASAYLWRGWLLTLLGRHEESIESLRAAVRLDPHSLHSSLFLGSAYFFAGRKDESARRARLLIEQEPRFWMSHWLQGEADALPEALEALERARALTDIPIVDATRAMRLLTAGRTEEARGILEGLERLAATRYVAPYYLAMLRGALNEPDVAFAHLSRAEETLDESFPLLGVDRRMDSLRSDPRFSQALSRLRLGGTPPGPARIAQ